MKLKVVNDYRKHVVLEAVTIGNLKSRIMDYFSIKAEDLMSERVLVPDGRDLNKGFEIRLLSNCFDLLELEDRSILDDLDGLRDGDTLLIGWKGPFIFSWISPHPCFISFTPDPKRDVLVDCYNTVSELKQKLKTASGEPVTQDNLPGIIFNAEDNKQLLCFGLYRYVKTSQHLTLRIYRNKYNERLLIEPGEFNGPQIVYFDEDGNKPAVRYLDDEYETKYVKYLDTSDGRLKLLPERLTYFSDIQLKMLALIPDLDVLPPNMGPATPSSMCLSNPPYGSAYHYDYGSAHGPYHLSGPPLHYDGGAMLPLGGLYGVPPLMDRYGMPMPHGSMAPRTGSDIEESSQRKRKGRERDWICPTCGYNNYSFRNVCNMSKCKTRRPGSQALRECLSR